MHAVLRLRIFSLFVTLSLSLSFSFSHTHTHSHTPRKEMFPSIVLSCETQLGINGGLMDRVSQVYEGTVYMELSTEVR